MSERTFNLDGLTESGGTFTASPSDEQTPDIAALAAVIASRSANPRNPFPHEYDLARRILDAGYVGPPVLAAAVREARAAELREAAAWMRDNFTHGPGWVGDRIAYLLRDRADRITEPERASTGPSRAIACCPGAGSMAHVQGCVNHPEAATSGKEA